MFQIPNSIYINNAYMLTHILLFNKFHMNKAYYLHFLFAK